MKMKDKLFWGLILGTVIASSICAHAAKADEGDGLLLAAQVTHAADMVQTLQISRDCRQPHTDREPFIETNPVLGRCPSQAKVLAYFAATTVGLTLLHKRWGHTTTYGWLAVEAVVVGRNYQLGIRGGF